MDVETYPYDSARYLKDDQTIAAYMDEAFKTGDPAFITRSLGAVARARGMTRVAQKPECPAKASTERSAKRATRS